ncbi:MAG TPA: hypothetical protein VGD37_12275, partial [Kofleriaceae bacterium]
MSTDKSINVEVEIAKGKAPLVFREADLVKIFEELTGPTRAQAELEYRAKFQIAEGTPLSRRALKAINRTLVDALAKEGVAAERVVVEAAEELATRMKWGGRVRGVFRYGGRVLIVVGVAADLVRIYRAHDKLKATLTSVGGWTAAT